MATVISARGGALLPRKTTLVPPAKCPARKGGDRRVACFTDTDNEHLLYSFGNVHLCLLRGTLEPLSCGKKTKTSISALHVLTCQALVLSHSIFNMTKKYGGV